MTDPKQVKKLTNKLLALAKQMANLANTAAEIIAELESDKEQEKPSDKE